MSKNQALATLDDKILFKDNKLIQTKIMPDITLDGKYKKKIGNKVILDTKESPITTNENKLFTFILYNFQIQRKYSEYCKCIIKRDDIKTVFSNKNLNTVKGINKMLDSISSKKLHAIELDDNGEYTYEHKYTLISGYSYDKKKDAYTISADPTIYDLLVRELNKGHYTPINLAVFMMLKRTSEQKLYDLIRQWSGKCKEKKMSLAYLRMHLCEENQYHRFCDFKRRILDPAVRGLNATGFFELSYTEVFDNNGLTTTDIIFKFKDLDKSRKRKAKSKKVISIHPEIPEEPNASTQEVPQFLPLNDDVADIISDEDENNVNEQPVFKPSYDLKGNKTNNKNDKTKPNKKSKKKDTSIAKESTKNTTKNVKERPKTKALPLYKTKANFDWLPQEHFLNMPCATRMLNDFDVEIKVEGGFIKGYLYKAFIYAQTVVQEKDEMAIGELLKVTKGYPLFKKVLKEAIKKEVQKEIEEAKWYSNS